MKIDHVTVRGEDPATMKPVAGCLVSARVMASDSDMDAVGVVMADGRVLVCIVLPDLKNVPASTLNLNGSTIAANVRKACDLARGLL